MNKRIRSVLSFIVIAGGVIGFKFYNKGQAADDVKEQMAAVIQQYPGYAKDKAYFDKVFDAAHEVAFDRAYTMGGRRRSADFNEDVYFDVLLGEMSKQAQADNRKDLSEFFETQRKLLSQPG